MCDLKLSDRVYRGSYTTSSCAKLKKKKAKEFDYKSANDHLHYGNVCGSLGNFLGKTLRTILNGYNFTMGKGLSL